MMAALIPNETPDQHGFVMCGLNAIFLYHLPMFNMENHRYQFIARVQLPPHIQKAYVADRASNPTTPYILGNLSSDLFTIPELKIRSRTGFFADIFRGIPDNPNQDPPLFHSVNVAVESIIYYRRFEQKMSFMPFVSYLIFGSGNEAHLAHFLTKEPDFDNVVSLRKVPDWLAPAQLAAGAQIDFQDLPWLPPYKSSPLVQPRYNVLFQGQPPLGEIEIGENYWFDIDSLNMPSH